MHTQEEIQPIQFQNNFDQHPRPVPQSQRYGGSRPASAHGGQHMASASNFGGPRFSDGNFEIQSQASNTSRFNFPIQRASPFHMMRGSSSQFGLGPSSSSASQMISGGGAPCSQHPEEFVSYFCFTCHCPPVCSECVIHGEHQGHQVQTLRKAYPAIQEQFEELIHNVGQKIEELQMHESKLEAKKRDIHQAN